MSHERAVADFSTDEFRAYACEHVYYEIDMVVRSAEAVAGSSDEQWPMNVAIEAFAVHLRNLLDFFYPSSTKYPTDVFAKHFFSDPTHWIPPAKTDLLVRSHTRAHKEVAHLTTGRKSDPLDKQWDIGAICSDLFPVITEFARSADLVCDTFESNVMARLSVDTG